MAVDQAKLLGRLLELSRSLSAMVDLDTYLQSILSAATELTESETASLMDYDEAGKDFSFRFVPWFHRDSIINERIPLEGSAAGLIFLGVKPVIIDDVKKDTRHYAKIDDLAAFETRSLMGVPLILHGRPVGVFEVFNKKDAGKYDEEDVMVLETLASLAATAIQNDLLESTMETTKEEARELKRLKNEFIAITSHELRTPLGLILGHSTFLKELIGNEFEEQVDAIIRNASRLKEIIENLSRADNQETGMATLRNREISIARVIEDSVATFRDIAIQKDVALKTEIPSADELSADADAAKISIVLGNLLKNALAFTNAGGKVVVKGERKEEVIKVSVQDSGVGIPSGELEKIFERFYQVESHLTRKHGGMGLGLSVAKGMIDLHNGRIWAESVEGIGSVFSFELPIQSDATDDNKKNGPFAL